MTDGVAGFFDSYCAAFNRLDAEAIAGHFDLPCILMDGTALVWSSRAQIVANMQALLATYRDGGFTTARYATEDMLRQGADNVVVNVAWTIERDDHAPWRFRTGYNLRHFHDGWRIVLCTAYEERAARVAD